MAKIQSRFPVWSYLAIFWMCINSNNGQLETNQVNLNFININEIKSDLLSESATKILSESTEFNHQNPTQDVFECSIELDAIKNAVTKSEEWALKILDSWGKFPSSIFEGNLYELGGFSECFHIERDKELYKTQYCLGHLIVDLNGISIPKPGQFHFNNINMHEILQSENEVSPNARVILPQPEKGPAITFGICLPASCPLDLIESVINGLIEQKVSNVSVNLLSSTCQFEETISEWRTIDKVTIGLLGIVSCLALASTLYDILCTVNKRDKVPVLLAFSFYTNGRKLLSYKKSKSSEMMHCVHGIRVISTQWVVIGHTYIMYVLLPTQNITAFSTFAAQYHNMFILSAFISVDTFFVLSGLFVTISMLKHLEKTNGRMNVPLLYFHRYLRLTPILGITLLFSISLLRFLGNGPLWTSLMEFFSGQCERNWWSTFLYVQNYVNPDDICLAHSWYLSVDMQLFLMAPPVVYLIYRFQMKTLPVWLLAILGSAGCLLATRVKYDLRAMMGDQTTTTKIYFPTHLRYSPWLIGIIAGYIFFKTRNTTIRIPRVFNIFAWALSLAIMAAVIFSNYPLVQVDSNATPIHYGLYDTFSRITWAIALCYIIFACVHGYGGPINWFLGHPLWQPLSRLSYSIYLVHFPVVIVTTATLKSSLYFSELNAFHAFLGNYVLSVFVSIIATLAFESPIVVIEKIIFGPKPKVQQNENEDKNHIQPTITEEKPLEQNGIHS